MSLSPKYTHPTEKWTLRGDAAASYLRMRADGHPAGGIDVYSRTRKQQEALYKAYKAGRGPVAANPDGDPPHMDGRAMDYRTTSGNKYAPGAAHTWASKGTDGSKSPRQLGKSADWSDRAAKYGWGRTVSSERWHREYNRAKDTHRAAGLKAALKTLGATDVKSFQKSRKLTADGVDGPITWAEILRQLDKIKPAPKLGDRVLRRGDTGPDVAELSQLLTARGHDVGVPANSFGSAVEKAVIAEQTAGGLKPVDGKVGPDTLAWLRKPPVVEPPDAPQDPDDTQDPTPEAPDPVRDFRLLQANTLNDQRFPDAKLGVPNASPQWPEWLAKQRPSLMLLCEVDLVRRNAIMAGPYFKHWTYWAEGMVSVWWDKRKWRHTGTKSWTPTKTGIHGGSRATLVDTEGSDLEMDVISVHIRPRAAFPASYSDERVAQAKRDELDVLLGKLARKDVATWVGGDFNTGTYRSVLEALGFKAATPHQATAGTSKLDAVWFRPGKTVECVARDRTLLNPELSDHKAWLVNGTIRSIPTN
ncbi:peptidoglycan-binding protein [Micropruina sp.]|uniref:peptidoglycan-binding protein n=1 Tax=Micropruina sp. TaxID=2737536 RepID=UPI0039E5A476